MGLDVDLISQFVKANKDSKQTKKESTVNGTVVKYGGDHYVQLDGSELLTPVSTTTNWKEGDRVTVMIKDHTATVTGNMSSPSATNDEFEEVNEKIAHFDTIVAKKIEVEELIATSIEAEQIRTDKLIADSIEAEVIRTDKLIADEIEAEQIRTDELVAGSIKAERAEIDTLISKKADITHLEANYATIKHLEANYANIQHLEATYAKIDQLDATNANVGNLTADVADINTLIFGSASGTTIQTSFSNAVVAQIGDAQIKSAMILDLTADKITSGSINTNLINIASEEGNMIIADETIQIKDEKEQVRVQIGKDASNDYSINIWDANGVLMFSEGGITDAAVKQAIIRDDMVTENANISASKLNISSLFKEINGSTETIKSTKIFLDDKNQTLDVSFKEMSDTVTEQGNTLTSQGTAISVIQGNISSKIWKEDINTAIKDLGVTKQDYTELKTQYSDLSQSLSGISAIVGEHTTQIAGKVSSDDLEDALAGKADVGTVTSVTDKVSGLEVTINGINTKVGQYEKNISDLGTRVSANETSISQTKESIDLKASKTEVQESVDGLDKKISDANTLISQNTEAIKLKASSSDVYTKDQVYTKSETDSQISVKSNEITLSVVENIEIGGRNLLLNSSFSKDFKEWEHSGVDIITMDDFPCAHISGELETLKCVYQNVFSDLDTSNLDQTYIFSADIRMDNYVAGTTEPSVRLYFSGTYDNDGTSTWMGATTVDGDPYFKTYNGQGWTRINWTVKFTKVPTNMRAYVYARDFTGDLYFKNLKFEKGNKPTDWSKAPEDIDSGIENAVEQASAAMLKIDDVITALVGDPENSSVVSQTEDGMYVLNLGSLKTSLEESIDGVNGAIVKTNGNLETLNDELDAISDKTSYIYIGEDDDGDPLIQLGESESKFKVRITNESVDFMEGSTKVAYINNNTLNITDALIDGELCQSNPEGSGTWVWSVRENGNYGLVWKGSE